MITSGTRKPRKPWWWGTVKTHQAADEVCGRQWVCACAACKAGREELTLVKLRRAQIVAQSVCVVCPWCGEPQPAPDGSHQWEREQVIAASGRRVCCSCDRPMLVSNEPNVVVL